MKVEQGDMWIETSREEEPQKRITEEDLQQQHE